MRIGLFVPCYIDAFFPGVGIATLELLERFGHDVDYPHKPPSHHTFVQELGTTPTLTFHVEMMRG
jgi:hypothetical protein